MYQEKKQEWIFSTKKGKISDIEKTCQEFCDFISNSFNIGAIDIDCIDNRIKLFSIENENDIENYSTQIEYKVDFNDVFKDFDPKSDKNGHTYYFLIKVQLNIYFCNRIFVVNFAFCPCL